MYWQVHMFMYIYSCISFANMTQTRIHVGHDYRWWYIQIRLIHICVIRLIYTFHDSFTYVHICNLTHLHVCDPTHLQLIPCGVKFSQSPFKAQSSKLERLFSRKRFKRGVRAVSFELWNSLRKCQTTWDRLYMWHDSFAYLQFWLVHMCVTRLIYMTHSHIFICANMTHLHFCDLTHLH